MIRPSLEPLRLSDDATLKNRIVLTAHSYCFDAGRADDLVAYVAARLRGGVAMVVLGETGILPTAPDSPQEEGSWGSAVLDQRRLGIYELLVPIANEHQSLLVEQLFHPGGQVWNEEGQVAVGPSAVPHARSYVIPRALDRNEIRDLLRSFRKSGSAIASSGLHGIELKADQGKLHHQFLSPRYNRRADQYGGSFERRMRFLVESLEELRLGAPSLVIGVRLPGDTRQRDLGGASDLTNDECGEVAAHLESLGLIDYVSLSGFTNSTAIGYAANHGNLLAEPGYLRSLGQSLRRVVRLPVIIAGRVVDLDTADELIRSGMADAVAMTRALIADPDLLNKTVAGDEGEVRHCTNCNIACVGNTWYGRPIRCVTNPRSGREHIVASKARLVEVSLSGHLLIVGGGPAGLEAAVQTKEILPDLKVTLVEATGRLGGRVNGMSEIPDRAAFKAHISWLEQRMSTLGIEVQRGVRVDASWLATAMPNWVVDATGAREIIPEPFAGASVRTRTPSETLASSGSGRTAVVVDGERFGDPLGVATFLTTSFDRVVVVTPFDAPGLGLDPVTLATRLAACAARGVELVVWSEISSVTDSIVQLHNHCTNEVTTVTSVDLVVWSVTPHPDVAASKSLAAASAAVGARYFKVGDAIAPRGMEVATREGSVVPFRIAGVSQDEF